MINLIPKYFTIEYIYTSVVGFNFILWFMHKQIENVNFHNLNN